MEKYEIVLTEIGEKSVTVEVLGLISDLRGWRS